MLVEQRGKSDAIQTFELTLLQLNFFTHIEIIIDTNIKGDNKQSDYYLDQNGQRVDQSSKIIVVFWSIKFQFNGWLNKRFYSS